MKKKDLVLGRAYGQVIRIKKGTQPSNGAMIRVIRGGLLGLQKIGISYRHLNDGSIQTIHHKIYDGQLHEFSEKIYSIEELEEKIKKIEQEIKNKKETK